MSLAPVPLPNLQEDRDQILERVLLNGVSNEHTKRAYRRALEKFLAWYDARGYPELSRQVLYDYRTMSEDSGAAPSSTKRRRRDWSIGERRKPRPASTTAVRAG